MRWVDRLSPFISRIFWVRILRYCFQNPWLTGLFIQASFDSFRYDVFPPLRLSRSKSDLLLFWAAYFLTIRDFIIDVALISRIFRSCLQTDLHKIVCTLSGG